MTTRTQSDLITETLEKLGVLAAGQTAEIEDTSRVREIVPNVIATLKADEIYYLGSVEAIPEEAFLPIVAQVAWAAKDKFGVAGDDLISLANAQQEGIRSLRIQKRGRPTYAPLKTEYM